ncbi:glycosyltransferase 61 family protein [Kordiimonas lipolytica]|uniref:Glycosyltransferase 61 family protein n=1 Tax=Kordiimonas lipolytica TaxID=1662421 RepID=A0ABV8UF60_9PROT|nr:glycosyltransferase 61 family protein [Kordiimonas lipolytica]
MRALKFREFDDVGLVPFEKLLPYLRGGFATPEQLPAIFRHRRRGKLSKDQAVQADLVGAPRLKPAPGDTFVYGGVLHWHFGHLIAEFVHRLWVLREPGLENATVLFVGKKHVPQVFRDCMAYFGVSKWQVVDSPCIIERLVIAEQGKSIGETPHPQYEAFLGSLAQENRLDDLETERRFAVLRGHLPDRRFLGEADFERFLEGEGYVPFRPEKHDLRSQLATFLQAEEIVMSDGSACHLFDLLPRTDARVALISRARRTDWKARDAKAVVNSIEAKCRELEVFDDTSHVASPTRDGRQRPLGLRYVPLDRLIDFLKHHRFLREDARMTEQPDMIADLQSYAALHLRDQIRDVDNTDELVAFLVSRLHENTLENERLKTAIAKRRGLCGLARRILG